MERIITGVPYFNAVICYGKGKDQFAKYHNIGNKPRTLETFERFIKMKFPDASHVNYYNTEHTKNQRGMFLYQKKLVDKPL